VFVDASTLANVSTFVNRSVVMGKTIQVEAGPGCCTPVLVAPLDDDDARQLAHGFAALADPVRLRLLSLIAAAGECCSCDLEGPLDKSQPTISHHTKALSEAGLIVGERRGRWTYWKVVPERMADLGAALAPG
jgi:ArsR family transcriptional regulator, arsenate/arsenite/antimonite-responsive transcriptional repressor